MNYQVAVLNFEGPLDLLLQLVEKSQLEVTAISLAELTEQYLAYLDKLQAISTKDLHQFIELASRLVYIKSLALLPDSRLESDPGVRELREQLATYQRYHAAAKYLSDLLGGGRSFRRPSVKVQASPTTPMPHMELNELSAVFRQLLAKMPKPGTELQVTPTITLEDMIKQLSNFMQHSHAKLEDFLGNLSSRLELIIAFLATLELVKSGWLVVTQDQQFGTITLQKAAV